MKTSGNHKVFGCFQGVEKGCIGNEWVNKKCDYFRNQATRKLEMLPAMMMNLSLPMRIMHLHQNHVREPLVALLRRRRRYTNSALMNPKMMMTISVSL